MMVLCDMVWILGLFYVVEFDGLKLFRWSLVRALDVLGWVLMLGVGFIEVFVRVFMRKLLFFLCLSLFFSLNLLFT